MMISTPLECTGEPGCSTSQLVVEHDGRIATLEKEIVDDRCQWREELHRLHARIDTLIYFIMGSAVTSLASLVIQLIKK